MLQFRRPQKTAQGFNRAANNYVVFTSALSVFAGGSHMPRYRPGKIPWTGMPAFDCDFMLSRRQSNVRFRLRIQSAVGLRQQNHINLSIVQF